VIGDRKTKKRFPWIRLFLGAYFSVIGALGFLRLPVEHPENPYIKPAAISFSIAGAVLLGFGLWAAVEWRNFHLTLDDPNRESPPAQMLQ
jgi:hypothetical protein